MVEENGGGSGVMREDWEREDDMNNAEEVVREMGVAVKLEV